MPLCFYQFKIEIKYLEDPKVYRQLVVPSTFTFHRFHKVIQKAFGWEDYHLYQFCSSRYGSSPVISIPHPDDDFMQSGKALDSRKIKLSEIFKEPEQKYVYIYDFGDDWTHIITLQKIVEETKPKAELQAGEGACPPEDCGSVPGYLNMLAILADPKHEEHEGMKDWLGLFPKEKYDAEAFDMKKAALR